MGDQWSLSRPRVTTGQMDIATLCLMFRKCSRLCSVSGCGLNYLDPTLTARSVGHWTRPSRGITSSEPPEILIKRDRISFKAPGGNAVNTHSIIMFLHKMAIKISLIVLRSRQWWAASGARRGTMARWRRLLPICDTDDSPGQGQGGSAITASMIVNYNIYSVFRPWELAFIHGTNGNLPGLYLIQVTCWV